MTQSDDGIHFTLLSLNETGANHLNVSAQPRRQQQLTAQTTDGMSTSTEADRRYTGTKAEGGTTGQQGNDMSTRSTGQTVVNPKDGNAVLIDDDGVGKSKCTHAICRGL